MTHPILWMTDSRMEIEDLGKIPRHGLPEKGNFNPQNHPPNCLNTATESPIQTLRYGLRDPFSLSPSSSSGLKFEITVEEEVLKH